jgi:Tetratrico peptide repeat
MAARLLAFVTLWVMDVERQLTELWASIDQLDEALKVFLALALVDAGREGEARALLGR